MTPALLVAGDPGHGVNRFAATLARALGRPLVQASEPGAPGHLHFTERLWGATPEEAADRVVTLAAAGPLTVTLHDLPQPSDGPRSAARRAAAYARVVAAARAVACCSHHEAALLARVSEAAPAVIPLPVTVLPAAPHPDPDAEIALLGFVYPGKGHAEALAAAAGTGLGVTALGRVSDGHAALERELHAEAERLGVRFTVTGHLGDDELVERCRRARVPLAAHRNPSASASIATWVGAGRRPLVPATRYTREMAALRPGTLNPYDDLAAALAAPGATWWEPARAVLAPGPAETAAAYERWWTA